MSWAPSSPLSGGAQTPFTSPTYTLSADTAPSASGKQYAITGVGGAGNGPQTTSASMPFTLSFFKPANLKIATLNGDGRLVAAPMNVYKQITRKAVFCDANDVIRIMQVTTTIEVPAGSEYQDSISVRAALSCHIGALSNQSAGIGDTVVSGIL